MIERSMGRLKHGYRGFYLRRPTPVVKSSAISGKPEGPTPGKARSTREVIEAEEEPAIAGTDT
jgi:hypothetical protein